MNISKKYGLIFLVGMSLYVPCWTMEKQNACSCEEIFLGETWKSVCEKDGKAIERPNTTKNIIDRLWQKAVKASCEIASAVLNKENKGNLFFLDSSDATNQCHINALIIVSAISDSTLLGIDNLKIDIECILRQGDKMGELAGISERSKRVITFLALNIVRPNIVVDAYRENNARQDDSDAGAKKTKALKDRPFVLSMDCKKRNENDAILKQWEMLLGLKRDDQKYLEANILDALSINKWLCSRIRRQLSEIRKQLLSSLLTTLSNERELSGYCFHEKKERKWWVTDPETGIRSSTTILTKDTSSTIPKLIGMKIFLEVMKKTCPSMILRCRCDNVLRLGLIEVGSNSNLKIIWIDRDDAKTVQERLGMATPVVVIDAYSDHEEALRVLISDDTVECVLYAIAAAWMQKYQQQGLAKMKELRLEEWNTLQSLASEYAKGVGITYEDKTSIAIEHMYPDTLEHALRLQEKETSL